jgi:hypothetical protein
VGEPEGKEPLRRHGHILGIILKWIVKAYDGRLWGRFI